MTRNLHKIIDQLSLEDAQAILKSLAAGNRQLADKIVEMALTRLNQVDPEEIASTLYADLESLAVEEVWDRAGATRHGYVETSEAAYQMIDEVFDPLLEKLQKYQKLGLSKPATQMCMGLLKAFYLFERESKSAFKDEATDAPGEYARAIVKTWQEGLPGEADKADLKQFIIDEFDGWWTRLLKDAGGGL